MKIEGFCNYQRLWFEVLLQDVNQVFQGFFTGKSEGLQLIPQKQISLATYHAQKDCSLPVVGHVVCYGDKLYLLQVR